MKRIWPIALALLACGDGATAPNDDATIMSTEQLFASKANFENTQTAVGSGTGSAFSGTFTTSFTNQRFSPDCTVDFVRLWDWFIDTGLSDEAIQQKLDEGYGDFIDALTIEQTDGTVQLQGVGLEGAATLRGPINQDGRLAATAGQYDSERFHWGAAANMRVSANMITGDLMYRATALDDPQLPGSCTFMANASGAR